MFKHLPALAKASRNRTSDYRFRRQLSEFRRWTWSSPTPHFVLWPPPRRDFLKERGSRNCVGQRSDRRISGALVASLLNLPVHPAWGKGFSSGGFNRHLWLDAKFLACRQTARLLVELLLAHLALRHWDSCSGCSTFACGALKTWVPC